MRNRTQHKIKTGMEATMCDLNPAKRTMRFLGASLAVLLVAAGAGQVSAQEMYKLSADLVSKSTPAKNVSMGGALKSSERYAAKPLETEVSAPLLDREAAGNGMKETRESILEQIAAAGSAFGKGLKTASSRCTGWQNGGIEQPWIGPDPTVERACLFQFDLPTK